MRSIKITKDSIDGFKMHLIEEERAKSTVQKYEFAIKAFSDHLNGKEFSKIDILDYRSKLLLKKSASSVNGEISAINAYLKYVGMEEYRVKFLKIPHNTFVKKEKELSEGEYRKLLQTSKKMGKKRLYCIIMTLCSTGIRVSELPFITVESLRVGNAQVTLKGKTRSVVLPKKLVRHLKGYCDEMNIKSGIIFRTSSGKPVDRSNIWKEMKRLSIAANVDRRKIYPHNLRHVFARAFYKIEKDLAYLADIMGHTSVETTRVYTAMSIARHERILNRMRLVDEQYDW